MIPAKATLQQLPFYRILFSCYQARQSGLLVIENGELKKVVYLEKGNPKGCRSNIRHETLGHNLIQQRIIDELTLKKILKECKEQTKPELLGNALIQRGLITPDKLLAMLEEQLLHRLYDLFSWQEGAIKLHPPKSTPAEEYVHLSLTTPKLILKGIFFDIDKNKKPLNLSDRLIPKLQTSANVTLDEFGFSGVETSLLRSLDGNQSLAETLRQAKQPDEAKRLIYALEKLGLIQLIEKSVVPPRATASAPIPASKMPAHEIHQRLEAIAGKDLYAVLGVDKNANETEIRKLYFKLAKEYHPDRLRLLPDPKTRQAGEQLFAKISEAYNTLIDPTKKSAYEASLRMGDQDAAELATKILESETIFMRARSLIKQGEVRKSRELLEQAIAMYADEPEYHLHLGWCLYKIGIGSKDEGMALNGKKLIEKHKDARKKLETGYYYLGEIAVLEGDVSLARKHYNRAMEISPNSQDAERKLRLLDMREEKREGQKGSKSFFKKG